MIGGWISQAQAIGLGQVAADLEISVQRGHLFVCRGCGRDDAKIYGAPPRWKCHGCGLAGDAVDLVAVAVSGAKLGSMNGALVRDWYAARGWCEPVRGRHVERVEPRPVPQRVQSTSEAAPPPAGELRDLWAECCPVVRDAEVGAWLDSRLGAGAASRVSAGRLAVALYAQAAAPSWAALRRQSWARLGYRLLVPMVDAAGMVRSVRARCVGQARDGMPKALPPTGFTQRGLVMASPGAVAMLKGVGWPAEVVVAEGEPQWLAACLTWPGRAVLGIVAGSWTDELAAKVPTCASVLVVTDHDAAGDRYAEAIETNLRGRCRVLRHGRVLGAA
jgi:hypothetical protein